MTPRFLLSPFRSVLCAHCRFLWMVGVVGGLWAGLLLAPMCAQPLASPSPSDRAASDPPAKYWIFLADSARTSSPAPRRRAHISQTGSPEAVRRRGQRGAASESLTRPIAPHHLAALRSLGVHPIVQSRWLQAVSARLAPAQLAQVRALAAVDSTRRIRSGTPATSTSASFTSTAPSPRRKLGFGPRGARSASSPLLVSAAPAGETALPSFSSAASGGSSPVADSSFYGASYSQLRLMNALPPLERGLNGRGVRIGFLDTGYRGLQHPAFDEMRREGRLLGIRDFTERPQTNNHGGGVVSAAAGYDPGVLIGPAHGAEVLAASTEYTPTETNVEEDYFVAGLEWLERRGVDVVNVSLGYTTFDEGEDSYTIADLDGNTGVTTRAVDAAAQLGVVVVVSAGNSGCGDPANCWFYVSTPADADSAITVGAVGTDSAHIPFSSRGPTADSRLKPDVSALGRGVVSAWNEADYARVNGTSFSSPLVTGVVAQMLQQNPRLTPMEVRRLLRNTASQSSAPDSLMGWGIVNADAAVRAAERRARERPPRVLEASPPYPSPASEQVSFSVRAPRSADSVRITLFDVLGRRTRTAERSVQPGPNRIRLSVSGLSPGVYLYRLRSDTEVRTGKITIVR